MYEVRFHGRGGQGAVTAASLLAIAAFKEGQDVQSFPMFGVERRGAPVAAFARLDDKPIDIKTQIYKPDAVVVLDPTLLSVVNIAEGLAPGGIIYLFAVSLSNCDSAVHSCSNPGIRVDATGQQIG